MAEGEQLLEIYRRTPGSKYQPRKAMGSFKNYLKTKNSEKPERRFRKNIKNLPPENFGGVAAIQRGCSFDDPPPYA